MELKPAALCYKTCRVPPFTLFLIALHLRGGLSALPVMQADKLLGEAVLCTQAGDSVFNNLISGELP